MNPESLLVTLKAADLRSLIAAALSDVVPASEPPREVFNRKQAADFLGTSVATLDRLARDGEIPSRRVGDSPRYLRGDLLDYVRGATESPSSLPAVGVAR